MKFTIDKHWLNEAIGHVSKAISSRTTIPILSGIKFDVRHDGITLTASDTDISIQRFIPVEHEGHIIVQVEQTGSLVIPAKFFVDLVRKLPSAQVLIERKEMYQILIRSGNSEVLLAGLDAEEYPVLPSLEENQIITLNNDLLKSMIRQTVFAASSNEATSVLTGVLWTLHDSTLKFVATDRHRLASMEVRLESTPVQFTNIVISAKTLNELYKLLSDQNQKIDIVVADNQVLFKIDSLLFFTRILDGTYPDTTKIIPQVYKSEIVFQTKELADAIDRAYLMSREEKTNIVRMSAADDGEIEISSSSTEIGKVTEQLVAKIVTGEPLKIAFNSKYMLDVLKVIDSETIRIGFTGAMSPMIVKPDEHTQILHLILPYRTTG
ncbi:DNA polymerase III subunit beta [Paenibacillus turpanensis]|uniref:DNA polymerase III subunit beta n=1 Tax=Paenibacillus turpanensis TaxID=2689078 RepID=UPI001408C86E|nr:DNA polymerase III subunit beta [Paenibacillus turpanensis]